MPFEPMGRPMKEYVVLPPETVADPAALSAWFGRAYRYAAHNLPPKLPKEPKLRAAKKGS